MTTRLATIAAMLVATYCSRAATEPAGLEFFEKQIRPILVENCYECHSAGSKKLKGGLHLDSRVGVLRGGDSGPIIKSGKPGESRMIEAIRYQNRDLQMPPKNPLEASEISALEKWVAMGAPDPREEILAVATKASGMSLAEGRKFWAFQPVANPPVPELKGGKTNAPSPIDAFIVTRLREAGLTPAPPADKRTLIRRATFDLIGLPPTQAEVDAFVADSSPDAFGKVIDRLLKSPHYGIRWGRHWLDVARYADSNGLDENLAYGNAWRYRDYVVNSFNDDKPYNRFVVEQVAGDLLPGANQETKTATGFLALGAKVLAEKDLDKLTMDVVDEQIDTVGKAFMGLTLGCARCHDHKFDPISQKDYYSLAAIFKSTRTFADEGRGAIKYWYEHSFATEEELKKIKETDTVLAKKKAAASSFKSAETVRLRGLARAKATEYLMAATRFSPGASLEEVAAVAEPLRLHSRVLHHCRLHLDYHRDDPFFGSWHQFAGDTNAIARHYRPLFAEADEAFAAARKKDPKAKTLADKQLELARAALYDLSGFIAIPAITAHAFDAGKLAEYERLVEEARDFESKAPDPSAAMGVADGDILEELPLHIRGSHVNLGEPVKREFPAVLRLSEVRPILPANQSGRMQLAERLADTRNPLTARVFVNRVWRWHFGRGLVETTESFGVMGDRPSHPELLDWLARHFMKSGWSVKQLHKLIMTSSTYQMATVHPVAESAVKADPANRLWWRFEILRLEAEQIRDSILAVAGRLDETIGGKTIPLRNRQFVFNHTSQDHTGYEQRRRRAIYLPVVRNHLCEIFQQFDYPDPATPTGNRGSTVVAPQALLMMNSPLVMDSAEAIAERVLKTDAANDAERVALAYRQIFARTPTEPERKRAVKFISGLMGEPPLTDSATVDEVAMTTSRRQAWSLFCQSLLASNEFMYLN
mgnify:CR=1 FL=1